MVLSKFGSLTREFYIVEIGTWENYGGKRVWWFIGGRYNEVLLYVKYCWVMCGFMRLATLQLRRNCRSALECGIFSFGEVYRRIYIRKSNFGT